MTAMVTRSVKNRGISSIAYNMLDLPQTVTRTDGSTVAYIYDAGGRKLRKLFTSGSTTTVTEYVNGIEYDNGPSGVTFIQTEEGRARRSGSVYVYEYDLKDHLGNTRVTMTWDPTDATQLTPKILQRNDYYAFGYTIQSLQGNIPSPKNEYLYNGKELQEETGYYDYGARFYDPVIGRWTSVDPLVEVGQESTTPYGYVFDDPIKNTDPDGRYPDGPGDDFVEGVKEGVTGYFTGMAHAVMNPGETIKNQFSVANLKDNLLNVSTMGLYGTVKGTYNLTVAAVNGDTKTLGNAVGGMLAEGATMLATDGAVKGLGAVKGAITNSVRGAVQDGTKVLESKNPFDLEPTHGLTQSKKQFSLLKENIKTNGIKESIKYVENNGTNSVVDGHHRLRAAKELDIKTVPAQKVELPYKGYKTRNDLIYSKH